MTFPQLCNCPNICQSKVLDTGFWFKNLWHWDIGFEQPNLDEEEEIQLENLLQILKMVQPIRGIKDKVPSKIKFFGWRLLFNKLPTKKELASIRVLNGSSQTACIFCNGLKESALHVFVECDFVLQVQDMVAVWFGAKDFVGAHLVTARLQYVRVQLHGFINKKLFFLSILVSNLLECWAVQE